MLVRNAKNTAELEAKRLLALKNLQIEISNESQLNKKVSEYRNIYEAQKIPPQYKDASEIAMDFLGNEMRLIQLLTSYGFTNQVATNVVKNVSSSGDGNNKILKLLQSSGNLKRKFESYNKDLLSSEFISNIVERFLSNYDKTLGGSEFDALQIAISELNTAEKFFPSREQIIKLESKLHKIVELNLVTDIDSIQKSIECLNKYLEILPLIESYTNNPKSIVSKEKSKEIIALMEQGGIPISKNIDSYINILSNIIANAEEDREQNKEDVRNQINSIKNGLSMILTPDSLEIINLLRGKFNLPSNANIGVVLDRTQGELLLQQERIEDLQQRESELTKDKVLKRITGNDLLNEIDNINMQLVRSVYDDNDLKTIQNTPPIERIRKYYINEFYNKIESGRTDYDNIYNEIRLDLLDAVEKKKRFREKITDEEQKDFGGRNIKKQQDENKAEIEIQNKINPKAVEKSERELDGLIFGQQVNDSDYMIPPIQSQRALPPPIQSTIQQSYEPYTEGLRFNKLPSRESPEFKKLSSIGNPEFQRFSGIYKSLGGAEQKLLTKEADIREDKYHEYVTKGSKVSGKKISDDKIYDLYNNLAKNKNYKTGKLTKEYEGKKKLMGTTSNEIDYDFKGLGFNHRKIKIGKGIEFEPEPKYINFGKYLLNKHHLFNDSKLTLRFPSGGAIPTLKPINVSEDFREFLIDLIENNEMSNPLYKSIPKDEKLYFQKVCKGAGVIHKIGLKQIEDDTDSKDLTRYKLLYGELVAGNNNKQMINELKGLILKFMNNGRMRKNEGQQLLYELSEL